MHGIPRKPVTKLCCEKCLNRFARDVRKSPFTERRNQMNAKHIFVMHLCRVLECRKHNGSPVHLHEMFQCAHSLGPLTSVVQGTKSIREYTHSETPRRELC